MSEVRITIGGRGYTVTCAPGQEDRITHLASMVEEKYAQIGAAKVPQEAMNMVFASLFLADELDTLRVDRDGTDPAKDSNELEALREANEQLACEKSALEERLANAQATASPQSDMFGEDLMAERLEKLAAAAEKCADALESAGQDDQAP